MSSLQVQGDDEDDDAIATLCEDWLLNYKTTIVAAAAAATVRNSNDVQSQKDSKSRSNNNDAGIDDCGLVLVARACSGLLDAALLLQVAAKDAGADADADADAAAHSSTGSNRDGNSKRNSNSNSEAVRQLLEKTLLQCESDEATLSLQLLPPLPTPVDLTSFAACANYHVDLDEFFEEYPDCGKHAGVDVDVDEPEQSQEQLERSANKTGSDDDSSDVNEKVSRNDRMEKRVSPTSIILNHAPPLNLATQYSSQQLHSAETVPATAVSGNPYCVKKSTGNCSSTQTNQTTIDLTTLTTTNSNNNSNRQRQQQPPATGDESSSSTYDISTSISHQCPPPAAQRLPSEHEPYGQHNHHHQQMHQEHPPASMSNHANYNPPPPPMPPQQLKQHRQDSSSWDDHHYSNHQNPFRTAREYNLANGNNSNKDYQDQQQQQYHHHQENNHHAQQQQQPGYYPNPPHQQPNGYLNPYQQQQQQQHKGYNPYTNKKEESPPPPQPIIRESLKRKFQPPKRGASAPEPTQQQPVRGSTYTATSTTTGGASTATAAGPPAVRRGVVSRPLSAQNHKQTSKDDTSNEDDLPEELKRFGKDLVEKIENEIMESGDSISFDQIAGLADQKQTVQEVVCWPMKRPDLFTGLRCAPNGLLLYGPPGTGKTLIGKAIAHESGATFFSISSSSLTSKWIGEGEKLVRVLFAVAAYRQPAVVFIDEIDSLLTQRKADENEASRRIKTEFLVQLDGTGTSGQGRVLVIGATNRPQELDDAARRRFTKRLYVPLPEEGDREILIRVLLEKNNHRLEDGDIKALARDTAGFSGADLKSLSTDAAMGPIRQLGARALEVDVSDVPPISYKHFRQALKGMKPSVSPADLVQYIEWDKTFGSKRAEQDEDSDDERA